MKSQLPAKARQGRVFPPLATLSFGLIVSLVLVLLAAGAARAQTFYPRMGLSASPTHYLDTIEVVPGEEFTLYACVFGSVLGEPLDQPFTSLSWVIHQVCCGAEVDILNYDFNPDLETTGHPLVGVDTSAETCYDQGNILLATLTCTMRNPTPGGVLWAAGPYDASEDCEGGNALFMGMAVTITVDGDALPTDEGSWGSIKAMYR
jgi:hypothetical protein